MSDQQHPVPPVPNELSVNTNLEVERAVSNRNSDLVDQIKETADKLVRDGASRGDMKILAALCASCVTRSRSTRNIAIAAR